MSTIRETTVEAKKTYHCDACAVWDSMGMALEDCQTDEQRKIVKAAQADGWRILPGQMYLKTVYSEDGAMRTYRARPGMDYVCRELGLFEAWA